MFIFKMIVENYVARYYSHYVMASIVMSFEIMTNSALQMSSIQKKKARLQNA